MIIFINSENRVNIKLNLNNHIGRNTEKCQYGYFYKNNKLSKITSFTLIGSGCLHMGACRKGLHHRNSASSLYN